MATNNRNLVPFFDRVIELNSRENESSQSTYSEQVNEIEKSIIHNEVKFSSQIPLEDFLAAPK